MSLHKENQEPPIFQIGDVVILKSDSHSPKYSMVITEIDTLLAYATCHYTNLLNGKREHKNFPLTALQLFVSSGKKKKP